MSRSPGAGSSRPLGVGVVGLGFMGCQHVASVAAAAAFGLPVRLAAVCDPDPARRRGVLTTAGNLGDGRVGERLFDPEVVGGHADPATLFADPDVDVVSLCTWTETHVPLACEALAHGRHVLVEKPLALSSAALSPLIEAADAAWTRDRALCMPALCMRFWPGWDWLHEVVSDGRFGPVRRARFERRGAAPGWARAFYGDEARCGGALFDLHVHDVDVLCWLFGAPSSVTSEGTTADVTTRYAYPDGPQVVAAGGWHDDPERPFVMRYEVEWDGARAAFDLGASPVLQVEQGGRPVPVTVGAESGYDGEVRHLLEAALALEGAGGDAGRPRSGAPGDGAESRRPAPAGDDAASPASGAVGGEGHAGGHQGPAPPLLRAHLADAVLHTRVLEAEARSLATGRPVTVD